MSKRNLVKSRVRGAILGTAIGDALGAPFEMMEKEQIHNLLPVPWTWGQQQKGIVFSENFAHPNLGIGQWTDDTQLMRTILWSIIDDHAIDPYGIAKYTSEVFEKEQLRGWSKSVISAAKRLSRGVPWYDSANESIGIGNGIAMKAAPLGIYLAKYLKNDYNYSTHEFGANLRHAIVSIVGVGQITHHELGIMGGVMQSVLVGLSFNNVKNKKLILKVLGNIEKEFSGATRFTDKLRIALKYNSIADVADNIGTDSKADKSWVTAAAVFLNTKRRSDAAKRMMELICQGGDCDTTGAMFGALAGARWGISAFPTNLRKEVEASKELLKLADGLYGVVST